jgi:hypothetical protein
LYKRSFASIGLLSLAAALLLLPAVVLAQDASVSINSPYIGVTVYTSGDDASGRFEIWNVLGDTSSDSDDHQTIMGWGQVQVMIDGMSADDEDALPIWLPFTKGGVSGIWGDLEDGAWVTSPYIVPGENYMRGIWQPVPDDGALDDVTVEQEVRVMHDLVRFKWVVYNNDLVTHQVGLRIAGDVITEPLNTGTVDLNNVVSMQGYPLIEERSLIAGTSIPSTVEFYNAQQSPTLGVRVIFQGQNATKPDMLGIDELSNVASAAWTYDADPLSLSLKAIWSYSVFPEHQPITENLGYGAFWKPVTVRAGQKRTIIHYIGNPGSTSVTNLPTIDLPKYTASVQGPKTLKYYIDPITGVEQFGPSSFRITAFLDNQDRYTSLRNCTFTLLPPEGIVLDPSETQYAKTIPEIDPGTDGSVSWVVAADGSRTGNLTYYVAVSANPMGSTIVKREINVPAVSKQTFLYGWQQISVPFELTDASPAALGLDAGALIGILRYDPTLAAVAVRVRGQHEPGRGLLDEDGQVVIDQHDGWQLLPEGLGRVAGLRSPAAPGLEYDRQPVRVLSHDG